jgi:hypothetical protein
VAARHKGAPVLHVSFMGRDEHVLLMLCRKPVWALDEGGSLLSISAPELGHKVSLVATPRGSGACRMELRSVLDSLAGLAGYTGVRADAHPCCANLSMCDSGCGYRAG